MSIRYKRIVLVSFLLLVNLGVSEVRAFDVQMCQVDQMSVVDVNEGEVAVEKLTVSMVEPRDPLIVQASKVEMSPVEVKEVTIELPVVEKVDEVVLPVEELVMETPRLDVGKIEGMINAHREAIGKPVFVRDEKLCSIAKVRAMEAEVEMWGGKGMHTGLVARSEGFRIRENFISMQSEEKAFSWWMNSSVHRAGIEGDFQFSCGACSGRNCVQLFTNWEKRG